MDPHRNEVDDRCIELLRGLAQCGTTKARVDYIHRHPVVLAGRCIDLALQDPPLKQKLLEAMPSFGYRIKKDGSDTHISWNPDRWPVGSGPLELIWWEQENGSISADTAIELVHQRQLAADLMYVYVKAVTDQVYNAMKAGQRQRAVQWQRLIVEATGQLNSQTSILEDEELWQLRTLGAAVWVEVASSALIDLPDGRIFYHARTCGETLLEESKKRGDDSSEAFFLERLGVLHLDPYMVNRQSTDYKFAIELWQQRLGEELGASEAAAIEREWPMPEPGKALQQAETLLRAAIDTRGPGKAGAARTALVDCLDCRRRLGTPVDEEEIRTQALAALEVLKTGENDEKIAKLTARLDGAGQLPEKVRPGRTILEQPFDELVQYLGETQLISLARFTAITAGESDPATGLRIIEKMTPLIAPGATASENEREELWIIRLQLLAAYIKGGGDGTLHRCIDGLPAKLSGQHIETAKYLDAAFDSMKAGREPEALLELEMAAEKFPALDKEFVNSTDAFRALLLQRAGTDAFNDRRLAETAQYYTRALPISLRLGAAERVADLLSRLQDTVELRNMEATGTVLSAFNLLANAVERTLDERGTKRLQAIYRTMMVGWLRGLQLVEAQQRNHVFNLFRLAKSRRFAATLAGSPSYDWRQDNKALELLDNIQQVRREAVQEAFDPELIQTGLSLDSQLMGPIGKHDRHPGMTAAEKFENLRHAFNGHVANRVLNASLKQIPHAWTERTAIDPQDLAVTKHDIQACLDERTVLLDLLVVDLKQGEQLLFAFAFTCDEVKFHTSALAETDLPLYLRDMEPETLLGRLVAGLRSELQAPTGPGQYLSTRAQALRKPDILLGPIAPFLDAQKRRGRQHLCIVPHRELHFLPFHLLGEDDWTLADKWVVTYLPSLHLLFHHRSRHRRRPKRAMVSIGMDFLKTNSWQLPQVETAVKTASTIAGLFDEVELANESATETAVTTALQETSFAFFYTHGAQCVYAPSFHRIFCAPDKGEDGAVNAFELQGLDLNSLEVLGTAACETALGRIDLADNLTGLPASFFQAGVQTMVGCLWEVHADAAETFFICFFTGLSQGETRLEAFEHAQSKTRSAFPLFMDWGAFHFMGTWA